MVCMSSAMRIMAGRACRFCFFFFYITNYNHIPVIAGLVVGNKIWAFKCKKILLGC